MFLLLLTTLAIGLAAQWFVKSRINHFNGVPGGAGLTGAEVAREILRAHKIHDVTIHEQDAFLGDHYDPLNKRLVLSTSIYHGTSISAMAVAAHECGHAIQHQQAYFPLHARMAAVTVTNFASQVATFLPLLGIFSGFISPFLGLAIMAGAWGIIMAFNLVTLPVEFDASNRARRVLRELGIVDSPAQEQGVAKVLNAAALTYVGAFVSSLLYFLYFLLPLLHSRDRE